MLLASNQLEGQHEHTEVHSVLLGGSVKKIKIRSSRFIASIQQDHYEAVRCSQPYGIFDPIPQSAQ